MYVFVHRPFRKSNIECRKVTYCPKYSLLQLLRCISVWHGQYLPLREVLKKIKYQTWAFGWTLSDPSNFQSPIIMWKRNWKRERERERERKRERGLFRDIVFTVSKTVNKKFHYISWILNFFYEFLDIFSLFIQLWKTTLTQLNLNSTQFNATQVEVRQSSQCQPTPPTPPDHYH